LARSENELAERVIGAAIEVHSHLGPGLLESAYEECLCYELSRQGLTFRRQVYIPVQYKGVSLDCCYKMDLVVEDAVVIEVKSVETVLPVHAAQLLTYLECAGKRVGLLINFNETTLKLGLKRVVNRYAGPPLSSSPRQTPWLRVSASRKESS
jgi:GxxExxY protein